MQRRRALGVWGEALVQRYLLDLGWQLVARNWRCSQGEADIVARDGQDLVVVEVKTRSGSDFGDPLEQITWVKAARLRRIAVAAAQEFSQGWCGLRVDVIGVLARPGEPTRLRHVRGVGG